MEELLPAAALEETLLARAQAAAAETRAAARAEAAALEAAAEAEAEAQAAGLRDRYRARLDRLRAEQDRSLPLGRRRLRAAFLAGALDRAFAGVWASFGGADWQAAFGPRLAAAVPAFGGKPLALRVAGWPGPGAEAWLASLVPGAPVTVEPGTPGLPELTAVGEGGTPVFRVSAASLQEELLETQREELVRALFPEGGSDAGQR